MNAARSGKSVSVSDKPQPWVAWIDRAYLIAETVVYAVVALCLVAGAVALLVDAISHFVGDLESSVAAAAAELLGTLLLVFVFVELLAAVRATMRERRLIAEPFLLVGIIATIKEIVVLTGAERKPDRTAKEFREAMIEVSMLAAVVLVLAISALLLRRREREPEETDH